MTAELITLDRERGLLELRTCVEWRQWLEKHYDSSPGIWLVRYKQHTDIESMAYEDLVREAPV